MSRVGKVPVQIAKDVKVSLSKNVLSVVGPKGSLSHVLPENIVVDIKENAVVVLPQLKSTKANAMWGLTRKIISNMVHGVSEGYKIVLEVTGVGFKVASDDEFMTVFLGHSHDIKYVIPLGIRIKCPKPTVIEIDGIDRQKVGQVAAEIKALRKLDPYKGKGIRAVGDFVRRKEGKKK